MSLAYTVSLSQSGPLKLKIGAGLGAYGFIDLYMYVWGAVVDGFGDEVKMGIDIVDFVHIIWDLILCRYVLVNKTLACYLEPLLS